MRLHFDHTQKDHLEEVFFDLAGRDAPHDRYLLISFKDNRIDHEDNGWGIAPSNHGIATNDIKKALSEKGIVPAARPETLRSMPIGVGSDDIYAIPAGLSSSDAIKTVEDTLKAHGGLTQQELVENKKAQEHAKLLTSAREAFTSAGIPVPEDDKLLAVMSGLKTLLNQKNI